MTRCADTSSGWLPVHNAFRALEFGEARRETTAEIDSCRAVLLWPVQAGSLPARLRAGVLAPFETGAAGHAAAAACEQPGRVRGAGSPSAVSFRSSRPVDAARPRV